MQLPSDFFGKNSSDRSIKAPKVKLQGNVKQFVLNQSRAQHKRYSNSYEEFSRKTKSQLSHNSTFNYPDKSGLSLSKWKDIEPEQKQPNSYSQEIKPQNTVRQWLLKSSKPRSNFYINYRITAYSRLGLDKDGHAYERQKSIASLNNLKQQLQNIKDGKQLMAVQEVKKYHSNSLNAKVLRKIYDSKHKLQNREGQQKVIGKKLPQYSQFIHSKEQYYVSTNFDVVGQYYHMLSSSNKQRVLNQKSALKLLTAQMFKILKSIFALIIQTLQIQKDSIQGKAESKQKNKKKCRSIQQYCFLYFSNTDKFLIQTVLVKYFLSSFASKIRPFLIYVRFIMYLTYQLSKLRIIFNSPYHSIAIFLIAKALEGQDLIFKSMLNAQQGPGNQTGILQIFKGLKVVKQIEAITKQIKICAQHLQVQNSIAVTQIQSHLKPFLNESFVLKDSYQRLIRTQMMLSWKYLKVPPVPFLPPIDQKYKLTLVVGLQDTLINFNNQSRLLKYRNGMDKFLLAVTKINIQIVVFSKLEKLQADQIINQIQVKSKYFTFRLYKDHLSFYDGSMIKDYKKLGRDFKKLIIVDSIPNRNQKGQSQSKPKTSNYIANTIHVSAFGGQINFDKSLLRVFGLIVKIREKDVIDVRVELKNHLKSNFSFEDINQVEESQQLEKTELHAYGTLKQKRK